MSDYQYILVERNEPIGIVSLNRPKELNALNFSLVSELAHALEENGRLSPSLTREKGAIHYEPGTPSQHTHPYGSS